MSCQHLGSYTYLITSCSFSAVAAMQGWFRGRNTPTTEAHSTTATEDQPVYTTAEGLQTGPRTLVESSGEGGGFVVEVELPRRINTMERWGKSLIQFGKFNNTSASFSDLYHSTEHEKMNYVEWIRTHTSDSSSPEFKDFARYVSGVDLLNGRTQSIMIPGSEKARRFKRE